MSAAIAAGMLAGGHPAVQFGTGDHLVVLPGLSLGNALPGGFTRRAYAWGFRGLADRYRVSIVQRPTGLPASVSTQDLADSYAEAIRSIGAAHIVGFSTGGMIAQQLVIRHPQIARTLTLVVSGPRLSEQGRTIVRRWLGLAENREWRVLRGDMASVAVDGGFAQWVARHTVGAVSGDPSPVDVADFVDTGKAVLAHDATAGLAALQVPTQLIAGTEDPFFDAREVRGTAAAIPNGALHLYDGSGHGVPKQHGSDLQRRIVRFTSAHQQ